LAEIVLRSKRTGGQESYDLHNANDPQLFHAASELKKAERIGRKIVLKLVCDLWTEPQVFERHEFDYLDLRSRAVAGSARDELSGEVRNLGVSASLSIISVKNVIWHLRYLGSVKSVTHPIRV
jgi:hypothetical protein